MDDRESDESLPRLRMDLVLKDVEFDDANRTMRAALVPDPRRYEHKEMDGTDGWYDLFDHTFIPDDVLADMARRMPGTPMYYQPQEISDAEEYVRSRRGAINLALDGNAPEPTFEDKSEAFLQSLARNKLGFVILSIDVVGSTKLSQAVSDENYARIIAAAVSELSLVVPQFHGQVLNYTGDGFIAYFAEPSFTTKNDLAIDCALTLRLMLYRAINPALEAQGLPKLGIRIGLDSGDAVVVTLGDPPDEAAQGHHRRGCEPRRQDPGPSRTRDNPRWGDGRPEPARRVARAASRV